jgi:hypothetical protein
MSTTYGSGFVSRLLPNSTVTVVAHEEPPPATTKQTATNDTFKIHHRCNNLFITLPPFFVKKSIDFSQGG